MLEEFLVSRQESAKILGVSTRTVDRYIAQEKFSVVRKEGKVFLDSRELKEYKKNQNPVVAQVVKSTKKNKNSHIHSVNKSTSFESDLSTDASKEIFKYKVLYEESKSSLEKRDELLRGMHYKLGVLETEAKNLEGTTVPLLQAENEKKELEDALEKLSLENIKLKEVLKSAKKGRVFYFILSLFFLLLIITIFIVQKGNLFINY